MRIAHKIVYCLANIVLIIPALFCQAKSRLYIRIKIAKIFQFRVIEDKARTHESLYLK